MKLSSGLLMLSMMILISTFIVGAMLLKPKKPRFKLDDLPCAQKQKKRVRFAEAVTVYSE